MKHLPSATASPASPAVPRCELSSDRAGAGRSPEGLPRWMPSKEPAMTTDPSMSASAEAEATSVYDAIGGRGALTAAVDAGYTTSTAFLEALAEAGIRYIFANLGSDHPGLIEALARARAEGREDRFPRLIVCPHETVALSAAHAYAMVTGEPQAVIVHVDVGTQNLSGAVSNAMRGRVPVLIFAGAAPFTLEGELP